MLGQVRQVALAAALLALAAGCTRKDEAAATTGASTGAVKEHPRGGANAFAVEATAPAELAVGDKAELVVTITARSSFHLNAEYPHNFKPDERAGLKFESQKVMLADAADRTPCTSNAEDTCVLRAKIPFTVAEAGSHEASGTVAFSVCDPEVCLIEKVPVTATVTAK